MPVASKEGVYEIRHCLLSLAQVVIFLFLISCKKLSVGGLDILWPQGWNPLWSCDLNLLGAQVYCSISSNSSSSLSAVQLLVLDEDGLLPVTVLVDRWLCSVREHRCWCVPCLNLLLLEFVVHGCTTLCNVCVLLGRGNVLSCKDIGTCLASIELRLL